MSQLYYQKLLCALILWMVYNTSLAQNECNLSARIAHLEESVTSLENGVALLKAYRDLGFAYYYNYELEKCKDIFDKGYAMINDIEVSDSTRLYYILDMHYVLDGNLNLDSLAQSTSLSYSDQHPVAHIIYVQQAYKEAISGSDSYNDSLLLQAISHLNDHPEHINYTIIGADYRSIYFGKKKNHEKAIDILSNNAAQIESNLGVCNKNLVRTLIRLGQRYVDIENLDSALLHYFKAEEILLDFFNPTDVQLAQVKLNIGQAYIEKSEFKNAIPHLLSAEAVCKKHEPKNVQSLVDIYNSLSAVYANLYLYDKAIDYNKLQIQTIEAMHDSGSIKLFAAYHNLGNRFWQLGDYVSSEKYLLKAESICKMLLGENHLYTAITYNSIGSLYQRLEKYSKAEDYFQRSLDIREYLYSKTHNRYANVLTNMGIMNRERGTYELSEKYLSQAITIFEENDDLPSLANAQNALSNTYRLAGEYNHSINLLTQAKSHVTPDGNLYKLQDPLKYLDILKNQVVTYFYAYVTKADDELIHSAREIADEAMKLFWWQYDISNMIGDKSELMNSFKEIFDYASAIYLELYKNGGEEENLMIAWNIVEDAKSVALAEAELKRMATSQSKVPKNIINELLETREAITILNAKQLNAVKENNLTPFNLDSLLKLKDKLLRIENQIISDYPDYEKALVSADQFDISEESKFLKENTSYLELLLLEDRIIALKALNGILSVKSFEFDDNIESQILSFSSSDLSPDRPMKDWDELFTFTSSILSWAMIDCEALVIISDKQLALIPFEIIPIAGQLAVELMPISYANSLKSISNQFRNPPDSGPYTFAGFAPQYTDIDIDTTIYPMYASIVRNGMWELSGSQVEVAEIKNNVGGKVYTSSDANKVSLLERLGTKCLLHLSMHAIIDERSPTNSRFVFNHDGLNEDKDLYLYEISERRSFANLAVLSACETGRGKVHNGDGVKSFSNALIQSGIPSVVMSLWKVPDNSTSKIMISFYNYLKFGLAKNEALQRAKLDYLNNTMATEQRHPFYWAGFVLIGDVSPVQFAQSNWPIYTTIGFFIIGICYLVIKRISTSASIPNP